MDQVNPEGGATPSFTATVNGSSGPDGATLTGHAAPAQNTAEQPSSKAAESPPAVDEQTKEPKGVGKRIDELTRLRRDAERERDHWREMAMRQQQAPQPQRQEAEQPKTFKDFGYDDKAYQDYLYGEARKHAEKAAKEAGERWKAEQEAVQRRAKFDERVTQFAKTVEDFDAVVTKDTPISEGMADFLLDSEEAGAIQYYLGNNPEEARKLFYLSPAKAGAALAKLEDRLVAERKKAAEKPVSKAPPPAPKIEAAEASLHISASSPDSDKLDMNTWLKRREKELSKRD